MKPLKETPPRPNPLQWIFFCFGGYALLRTGLSLYHFLSGKAIFQVDLYFQYDLWLKFIHRDTAGEVFSHLTYLPHVWLLLTPLFCLGWVAAKWIWFVACIVLHIYIARRISTICELNPLDRRRFLILYFCILGVGLTIALGNLVILSFAAVLSAFPCETEASGCPSGSRLKTRLFLFLSTVKQTIVFPVFLMLLFRRPRLVIPVGLAVLGILIGGMWWAHVPLNEIVLSLRKGNQLVAQWMQGTEMVSLAPLLEPMGTIGTLFAWGLWAAFFLFILLRISEPFIQFCCLLLIAVIPVRHRDYDMFIAAPVVALLLKQGRLIPALIVTLFLSGLWDMAAKQHFFGIGAQKFLNATYHQALVFGLLAVLFWLEFQHSSKTQGARKMTGSGADLDSTIPV